MASINDLTSGDVFSWERSIGRSWEEIEVDNVSGQLQLHTLQRKKQLDRKKQLETLLRANGSSKSGIIEKGMIRYLYIVLDLSSAMDVNDFKPTRKFCCLEYLTDFIHSYFDQNPISQLGIIVTHNQIAEKITELSGNPLEQIERLKKFLEEGRAEDGTVDITAGDTEQPNQLPSTGGDMSIQNSLIVAESTLRQIPPYGSREVLFIHAALYSVDPTDILQTITAVAQHNIVVNVISLTAEMHIFVEICKKTAGTFSVVQNRDHLKQRLMSYIPPSPLLQQRAKNIQRRWIKMGFPIQQTLAYPSLCACHSQLKYGGYLCPRCQTKFCELPTECVVCGTTLVLSPHLARTYHHLFPVDSFDAVPNIDDHQWSTHCYSCQQPMINERDIRCQCPRCKQIFCVDCDEYIHTALHNCPGCSSRINLAPSPTLTPATAVALDPAAIPSARAAADKARTETESKMPERVVDSQMST